MRIQRIKPCLSDLVFIAALFIALASGRQMLGIDSDLGRHLTIGNYILDERLIPTRDLLSHTRAGLSRPPYEWLSQVIFAAANRLLGLDGVILLTAAVIAAAFALVYRFANRRSQAPVLALTIVFLAMGASSLHWLPRPHIFTFLLLAIWVELLDQFSDGKPVNWYIFPVLMILWSNLHGGFIFGILAWIAYFAGWVWDTRRKKSEMRVGRRLLTVGVTSAIATIITPGLWRNWEAVLNNRSSYILNRTVETMRPNLTEASVLPYTLLLFLAILLFTLTRKTSKPGQVFLLGGLGIMSLLMARNIPLFAIACTPILAELGAGILLRTGIWTQVEARFAGFGSISGQFIWSILAGLLAIAYFSYYNFRNGVSVHQFDPVIFPVYAVNFLEANPQNGRMFNEFNWGGYLQYRLGMQYPVFIDSQSDFYGEKLIREYDQILNADGNWRELLSDYSVDWALIPVQSALAGQLEEHPGWEIAYKDGTAIIFLRLRVPDQ